MHKMDDQHYASEWGTRSRAGSICRLGSTRVASYDMTIWVPGAESLIGGVRGGGGQIISSVMP